MYLSRQGQKQPLLAGFFSAKLKQHQPRWLPCEIEALAIASACNHFRPYIIQSQKQTHVYTDSRPCVLAYDKLIRGEFSASSRIQTFLTIVNHLNVTINHLSGASNIVADFASRNAPDCTNPRCQICNFNNTIEEAVVFKLQSDSSSEVNSTMFTNRSAWREIQASCGSLTKVKEHLTWGTSPSKKCNKSTDTKRYLHNSVLARDGLIIIKEIGNPWKSHQDRIVVPRSIVPGLLTAIHLKLNHPSSFQLKQVFNRCFFALDIDKHIASNTDSCYTCTSLKNLPKHINQFTTSEPSSHIGQRFSIDVLRRAKQTILVSRESVSSYTGATFIRSEKAPDLLEGIVSLILPLHPSDGPTSIVRSDPAPGFQTLHENQPLKDKGIIIELGRYKNPNKNPIADKAIQELESEILRIEPSEKPLSSSQLNFALCKLNSRIRHHGLSSYELMFRRNQYTAEQLNNSDQDVIALQHTARNQNHPHSHKSQQPKSASKTTQPEIIPLEGSLIYLRNDKTKHKARDLYLVVSKNGQWLNVQKILNNQLRSRSYEVHASECICIKPDPHLQLKPKEISSDEDENFTRSETATDAPSNITDEVDTVHTQEAVSVTSPSMTSPLVSTYDSPTETSSNSPSLENTQHPLLGTNDVQIAEDQSNAPSSSVQSDRPVRTSGRTRRRPKYLDDYVTSSLNEEENEGEVATPGC